jgi:signal transduction histidine kinase
MERLRKEIDDTIKSLKEESQKNFSQESYGRIVETGSFLLHRSEEIGYLKGQYGALNLLGNASFNICDYEMAQKYFFESISIAEKMKDDRSLSFGYNNIGIILFRLKQFKKALEYYEKALELKLKHGEKSSISTSYNNIGLIYNNLKDYDKALEYFSMAIKIDREINNDHALARELNNIGLSWKYKNDPEKSLGSFLESYDVSLKAEYKKGMATALTNIATHYLENGKEGIALEKALEGEQIAGAINSNSHLLSFYGTLSEAYEKKGDFKNSLEYFKKMHILKDRIFSEESHSRIFEMQIKYETEKKEKEKELYRLRSEELLTLNATKDKFFRIIHHDLLNPFTAIHSTADFLDKFYDRIEEKKRKNYVGMILGSSERLLKLMDNLFAWVKTQSGEIDYKPEKVDMAETVKSNLELLKNNLHAKEIMIDVKCAKHCFVIADRNMTDTIVRNLIANAIKFTFNKGLIKLSVTSRTGRVRLTIEDNGIGISKENIDKLFKVSETFSTPGTNDEKGTGLGLILVNEFLDLNRGRITVKSKPGKGSKFTIELPKYI